MAQSISVKLSKFDNQPWGFRLQGGKDFAAPLTIQKVNGGSLAEKAGLRAGDAIVKINGNDIFNLRHKEAQEAIAKAGNNFELLISRGGVWKPQVTPLPEPVKQTNGDTLFTKTSLAANKQSVVGMFSSFNSTPRPFVLRTDVKETAVYSKCNNNYLKMNYTASPSTTTTADSGKVIKNTDELSPSSPAVSPVRQRIPYPLKTDPFLISSTEIRQIGSGHNSKAAPFKAVKSSDGSDVKLINKQFNSPLALYSEESIAETLSAQAEVLAQGVLGVNFKKNEKSYNSANSEVFKMVQEIDRQPKEPEPAVNVPVESSRPAGLRPVEAPTTKPPSESSPLSGAHTRCGECDRLIVGVFVRIKDKNLHVECFKCTICGTSLKNVGYYNINNKLYCDIHARQVARSQPPAPNVEPVTVNPGASIPSNAMTAEAAKVLGSTLGATSPTKPVSSLPSFASNAPAAVAAPVTKPVSFNPSASQSRPGLGSAAVMPASGSYGPGVHSAPRRGRGILKAQVGPGVRIPHCALCNVQIRGPFVTAMNRTWCPDHFVCGMPQCRRHLQDCGFVEEKNELYCEACFENYLAPVCNRCQKRVKGDCLNAINKQFHPECFSCAYCGRLFGNNHFYLEDGLPYCEADWNELFTTKCHACGYPIEAGDRWVEAMNNNYHSQCFNCVICKKNLEGLSFLAKGGRPMCKSHAH